MNLIIDLTPKVNEALLIQLAAETKKGIPYKTTYRINERTYFLTFRGETVACFKEPGQRVEYKIKFS